MAHDNPETVRLVLFRERRGRERFSTRHHGSLYSPRNASPLTTLIQPAATPGRNRQREQIKPDHQNDGHQRSPEDGRIGRHKSFLVVFVGYVRRSVFIKPDVDAGVSVPGQPAQGFLDDDFEFGSGHSSISRHARSALRRPDAAAWRPYLK